jgi:hypothetical protein
MTAEQQRLLMQHAHRPVRIKRNALVKRECQLSSASRINPDVDQCRRCARRVRIGEIALWHQTELGTMLTDSRFHRAGAKPNHRRTQNLRNPWMSG